MTKPLILTSPKGKAIFPHLTEADYKFKPEGEYHVKLECNKADCEKVVKQIIASIGGLNCKVYEGTTRPKNPNVTNQLKRHFLMNWWMTKLFLTSR